MYQKILVALDGSESSKLALSEAIRMAKLAQANVRAVYVIEEPAMFTYAGYYDPIAMRDALREEGRLVLADAQRSFTEAGVSGDVEVLETESVAEDVASALQRYAQSWGADLVVLGTHGRRGLRRMVIGSVAERFLRFSTCPVLLIRSESRAGSE
jgi:nucleotide-binding universal stress UspA family protein